MSLLRELNANFGQFSSVLTAEQLLANVAFANAIGGNVVVIPANPAETTIELPGDIAGFISASEVAITVVFNPANFFVGRIIAGVQRAAGSVAFAAAPGTSLSIIDSDGGAVPLNTPIVYQGGCGSMIVVEQSSTSLVLQGCGTNFGQRPVVVLPSSQTDAYVVGPGVKTVVSRATASINVNLNALSNANPGFTLTITNTGAGTITLGASSGTVTYIDLTGSTYTPTVATGETQQFVCLSHVPGTCVLQLQGIIGA
jgi:hypothetical protein